MFSVLRERNYRRFARSQIVSLIGTWMQRVAQDWLVLSLSGGSPVALGAAAGLQFLPILFLSLWAGVLADRVDSRRTLMILQTLMALSALGLGLLDLTDTVQLWSVYLFCLVLGCLSALDAPIFETYVVEMVGTENAGSAVALNSMNFNVARIIGPAVAGSAIAWAGTGWVFIANAASYAAVVFALLMTDKHSLYRIPPAPRAPGMVREGLRYLRGRADLGALMVLVLTVGVFANFTASLAVAAVQIFALGVDGYGYLSTMLALGMLLGAAGAVRRGVRGRPRLRVSFVCAAALGSVEAVLGLMPTAWLFGLVLIPVGAVLTLFVTAAHSTIQLSVPPWVRGRVMGLYMMVLLGGTPLGAPLSGWLAQVLGARAPFLVGGAVLALATLLSALLLLRRDVAYAASSPGSDGADDRVHRHSSY
ncbi:MFS transporter [Streptomyces sp. NPDC048419]|uniref:MFS transporter n=1 Tax=Streptomyces sp. NPDC048419 TaxID=3365547 RepID=UPI00372116E2